MWRVPVDLVKLFGTDTIRFSTQQHTGCFLKKAHCGLGNEGGVPTAFNQLKDLIFMPAVLIPQVKLGIFSLIF